MKINEIGFVSYPTKDMSKARAFYEGVLGLVPSEEFNSGQWVEYNIGHSTLSLGSMDGWDPNKNGPNASFEVENFEEAIEHLKKHNIPFTMGPIETPVCFMVMFQDPDGNTLIIHKKKNS
jgi:predicted enzyme related to lactoylglutathione lyase